MAADSLGGGGGPWVPPYERASAPTPSRKASVTPVTNPVPKIPKTTNLNKPLKVPSSNPAPKGPSSNVNKPFKVPDDLGSAHKAPKTSTSSGKSSSGDSRAPRKARGVDDLLTHRRKARAVQQTAASSTGKKSVIGGAIGGAAGGAAGGAVFGPEGAVVGAVLGGATGAAGANKAKKAARAAKRAAKRVKLGPGYPMIVACFLICMLIWALSPLSDKHENDAPAEHLKRGAAIMATFLILGLVANTGRGMTKVAASLGSLITLTLLMSDRDVFSAIANKISGKDTNPAAISDAGSADLNDIHVPAPADVPGGVGPDQDYRNIPHDAFGRPL